MFIFYLALKIMAGVPFPETGTFWDNPSSTLRDFPKALVAWVYPAALILFGVGGLAIERVGRMVRDPRVVTPYLPIVGAAVFITAFIAIPFDWKVVRVTSPSGVSELTAQLNFDGGRLLWVFFFTLLWGAISAGVYTLGSGERIRSGESSPVVRSALNWGYGILLAILTLAIYLTQSRGPWLGLGAGLVTFAVAMWLVGRQYGCAG